MAEAETPVARAPLDGLADPRPSDWTAGIALSEIRFRWILNLRGDPTDGGFAGGVEAALGLAPPIAPNTVAERAGTALLWLGPDEWLVVAGTEAPDPRPTLETALSGVFATLVELSDNYAGIRISGAEARPVLEKGWSVDLHPRAFGPGRCAQSHLAHAPALLWQRDELPSYELFVRPSFARYAWDWLLDASGEFGVRIA